MKKHNILSTIFSVMIVLIWALSCSKSDNPPVDPAIENPVVINISSISFSPDTVTINAGTVVKWVNNDAVEHSAISDDGSSFDTGTIAPGSSVTYKTSALGIYDYHCSFHPGMKGVLQVVTR